MDTVFVSTLLYQSESETLDFKRAQYRLAKADNDTKSELVKDILAFANAWKTADAHILIGVDENPGGKARVVGVHHHLDDADLQQLIKDKTNRPVNFGYSAITVDEKQIGIITIKCAQQRPLYLRRKFGTLKEHVVYLRRGTATIEATPDEVFEMGLDVANREGAAPVIELAFGDPSARERWGTNMVTTSVILIGPPPPKLPGLEQMLGGLRKTDPRKAREARAARAQGEKYDIRERFFGAELRQYRAEVKLLTAVGFWVKNRSSTTARDVRIQIDGIIVEGLRIVDETDYPKEPNSLDYFSSVAGLVDRDLWVEKHGRSWTAHLSVGKLQPHAECLAAGQTVYRCSQAAGGADGSDHLWRQYT